jgi:mannonate dehydratase
MGADVAACAERFAPRIKFIHFRDIRGTAECFEETFHDNGPTDMARMLRRYHDCGLDVPIRVDHVPTMEGEDNHNHGYALLGRLFAVGYMKGIMDASGIPYR